MNKTYMLTFASIGIGGTAPISEVKPGRTINIDINRVRNTLEICLLRDKRSLEGLNRMCMQCARRPVARKKRLAESCRETWLT